MLIEGVVSKKIHFVPLFKDLLSVSIKIKIYCFVNRRDH